MVVEGGVVQQPNVSYKISGYNLNFIDENGDPRAPADGVEIFGLFRGLDVSRKALGTAAARQIGTNSDDVPSITLADSRYANTAGDTFTGDVTVSGDLSVTGSVDGRDIASDGSKLDTIESGADVTDTANVTAAGALMASELTNESAVKNIDQELTTTSSVDFSSVTVSGTVTADDFNTVSDIALKENVETISDALDTVIALRGTTFTFKESGKDSLGLIAQEVEEVVPSMVATHPETGNKTVSYSNLVGLLVEAIKEQQSQIDDLKSKVYK